MKEPRRAKADETTGDTGTRTTPIARARRELASFLRERRDAAVPAQTPGRAPRVRRRRARGLRREEVAEAAGISTTWYTWLEQARPVTVSRSTLDAIAVALRLDDI